MKDSLEEAAIINYKKLYEGEPLTQDVPIDAFKQGVKWQQERSYSEEDIKLAFMEGFGICREVTDNTDEAKECFNYWFEQFKKK
jgi:hypothetical protein